MKTLLVLSAFVLLLPLIQAQLSPGDSTCKALWLFNLPCSMPNRALVAQIHAWRSRRCDEQEKCLYKILTETPTYLEVMHTSRDLNRTTMMYFDFNPPESTTFCKVWANSVTSPSNANKTNEFCLFHNLFQGSALIDAPGFKEITNEKMCPSFASATCLEEDEQ